MAKVSATAEITCAQCGDLFTVTRKRNWHNRRFCGADCAKRARQNYRPEYLRAFAKRPLECVEIGTKTCRVCSVEKPVSQFSKSSNYADGRTNACRPCLKAYSAELAALETTDHRAARLAKHRASTAKWKLENKEQIREYTRRTTKQNTDRYLAWRRANPERAAEILFASNHKRRAKKKGGLTGRETRAWFDAQKKVCHWCGESCAKDPTIDHLTALSRGGAHELRNLVIACRSCNSRKHAKDPLDFAREIGKLL